MKKKFLPRLLLVLLVAAVVVACSFDSVVGEAFVPPAPPVLGESITFTEGEIVNLTNGDDIVSIRYVGIDEYGQHRWECRSMEQDIDCDQHHETWDDFFLGYEKVGETTGATAKFVTDWMVIK